jgi:hypothetical protein
MSAVASGLICAAMLAVGFGLVIPVSSIVSALCDFLAVGRGSLLSRCSMANKVSRRLFRAIPSGSQRITKSKPPEGSYNRRNDMAQETYQGDRATKPWSKHLAPQEAAETGTIHVLELPETPAMAVAKLHVAGGDWFHRVQRESIGIGPRTHRVGSRD